MALDKWIAVLFFVLSVVYGYAAYNYPLLPFERHMSFLPNTLPMALSVLGVLIALVVILTPSKSDKDDDALSGLDIAKLREYKIGQASSLLGAMVLYAVLLKPAGFLIATPLFLVGTGWILGERKPIKMIVISVIGASAIWYLVQEVLGIFLQPLPTFLLNGAWS